MEFLGRFSIGAKIGAGAGALVLLLVLVAAVSYESLQTASKDFVQYRSLARQSNMLGRVQANMVEIRLHAQKYQLERHEESLREIRSRFETLWPMISEARMLFDDREALEVLRGVDLDGRTYAETFFRLVDTPPDGKDSAARLAELRDALDRLGPKVDSAIENMKLANLARQDALGPRANEDVQRAAERAMLISLAAIVVGLSAFLITSAAIARPIAAMTSAMHRLAEGELDVTVPARDYRDEVGRMARAVQVFKEALQRMEQQRMLRAKIADVSLALQLADTNEGFADALLGHLAPLLDAGMGLFYIRDDNRFRVAGAYACDIATARQADFLPGEGIPGQCATDRRPIFVNGLPSDSRIIGTGLAAARPDMVACVPITAPEGVLGVLEIARLGTFTDLQRELLEQVVPVVALNLGLLDRNLRTARLLEQTRQQAEELRVQTEELQASEDELRVQREELQAANDSLEEKTRRLEQQAAELDTARLEADRRAAEVASASEYKSLFLANMSHELRTPLNSILILARTLADNEQGNLAAEQIESVAMIGESGNHLLALINDILDLSKIEAGKLELLPEDFRLEDALGFVGRTFAGEARKKGIGFRLDVAADVPAVLHADRQRFTQVLINLAANAVKFTDRGGVVISAESRADGLCFSVRDTGVGIPTERIDHIFGAFQQLDGTTSRRYGGTGLGLAICKRLVELMGGRIDVSSSPGTGSVFSFTLPRTVIGRDRHTRFIDRVGDGDTATILVVEADHRREAMLGRLITSLGLTVVTAGTADTAVAALAGDCPAAVLLDLDMPDGAGLDVLRRLKADPNGAEVPVTVISADAAAAGAARTLGAAGRIGKPVTRDEVAGALVEMLGPLQGMPGRKRLLVVEDNVIEVKAVERLFRPDAMDIVVAHTGEEAIALLAESRFDAVILDLMLPDMSGFTLLERVWAEPGNHPPVIIYSAHDLTTEDIYHLRSFAESVVVKGRTSSRLREEVLHAIEEPSALPEPPAQAADGLKGRRVLVVDDDVRNLVALSKALRQKGFEVDVAADGDKALAMLEAGQFDAMLTDIMMPDMDGYELIRRVRARDARLPIVAVTAKAMKGDSDQCLRAGANAYLPKPLDLERLMEVLGGCLA
jgi:signal transduction histidine kinase/DNA-binding response OmpR family regulator/HAMP domain-containing protein